MILEREFVQKWLNEFKTAWLNKDIDRAVALFNKTTSYSEEPFVDEVHDLNGIRELWEGIEKQEIYSLILDIIAIDGLVAVAHYYFKFKNIDDNPEILPHESDGINVFRFDEDLNCVEFRQWWMRKK